MRSRLLVAAGAHPLITHQQTIEKPAALGAPGLLPDTRHDGVHPNTSRLNIQRTRAAKNGLPQWNANGIASCSDTTQRGSFLVYAQREIGRMMSAFEER